MTGRDYRAFLSTHRCSQTIGREDETDKLLVKMKDGIVSSRYRPQDYEKLRILALQKKHSANQSLLKMSKLQAASHSHRENTLLKQHHSQWKQQGQRLAKARKTAATELCQYLEDATSEASHVNMFILEMEELQLAMDSEREGFRTATVEPVHDLRGDLVSWLDDHEDRIQKNTDLALRTEHGEILKVVKDVKGQQQLILNQLKKEEASLDGDLTDVTLGVQEGYARRVTEGVPPEAEALECPDGELRELILNEFLLLDQRFKEKLRDLDEKYEHVHRPPLGGWTYDDHSAFLAILDQYPHTLNNRRHLYMDMLKRRFNRRTRSELVAHEDWRSADKYYRELRRTQVTGWARAKEELYHKAVAVFADAYLAEELRRADAINANRQKEICSGLYKKVEAWREKKLLAAQLEADIQARNREKLEEERQTEMEREKRKRAAKKGKINEYHERRKLEEEHEAAIKREELLALQIEMDEQADRDRERVAYRRGVEEEKRKLQEARIHQAHLEEIERDKRLDALRQMVAVHVESDPYRVMKPTMASNAKAGIGAEEDINIQKPLFDMRGFSSEQVEIFPAPPPADTSGSSDSSRTIDWSTMGIIKMTNDPRMKLEQALREAGLHENPYARNMIYSTKPIKPPRKDMESTVLKNLDKK